MFLQLIILTVIFCDSNAANNSEAELNVKAARREFEMLKNQSKIIDFNSIFFLLGFSIFEVVK